MYTHAKGKRIMDYVDFLLSFEHFFFLLLRFLETSQSFSPFKSLQLVYSSLLLQQVNLLELAQAFETRYEDFYKKSHFRFLSTFLLRLRMDLELDFRKKDTISTKLNNRRLFSRTESSKASNNLLNI